MRLRSFLPLLLIIEANAGSWVIVIFATKDFSYMSPNAESRFLLLKYFSPTITSMHMHFSDTLEERT